MGVEEMCSFINYLHLDVSFSNLTTLILLLFKGCDVDMKDINNNWEKIHKHLLANEKALLREKIFSENLLETANIIVLVLNASAEITLFNKFAEVLTGYTKEEVMGKNWFDLFIPARNNFEIPEVFSNVLKETPKYSSYENAILCKDGSERVINWTNTVIIGENRKISGVLSIGSDITERKRIEKILKKSERQHRLLAENIEAVLWEFNIALNSFTYVAPQVERILGYTPHEWTSLQFWSDRIHENDRTRVTTQCAECTKRGESHKIEYRFQKKDGSFVWLRDIVQVEIEKDEPAIMRGLMIDITKSKNIESELLKANKQLRQNEAKLNQAQSIAKLGSYEYNLQDDSWSNSHELNSIFGINDGYIRNSTGLLKIIHLDFRKEMLAYMRKNVLKQHKKFNKEFKIIDLKTKQEKWVHGLGDIKFDKFKKPIEMFGTIQDITDRKRVEKQISRDLQEKKVMLQEIHHRVKNNMNVMKSLVNLQFNNIRNSEDAKTAFEETRNRIFSMASVHEQLYHSSDFSEINIESYIRTLSNQLVQTYRLGKKISIEVNSESINLDINRAIPCGLILNELITNAYKHAFSDYKTGKIQISFKAFKNMTYEMSVQDNGSGLPVAIEIDQAETLGLKLINILTQQINGNLEIIRLKQGTKFVIRF